MTLSSNALSSNVRARALAAVILAAASATLAGCSLLGSSAAAPTPSSTDGSSTDVFKVKVGDCINNGTDQGQVTTVPAVDCAKPHDSEAYASIIMDAGTFPGSQAVTDKATAGCAAQFNTFVGIDYTLSKLEFAYYYPTEESWANGDREILCLIDDPKGQTTGSLKGAAR